MNWRKFRPWIIAKRLQLQGSELSAHSLRALEAQQQELEESFMSRLQNLPDPVRGPVIRLRASLARAEKQLVAVRSDVKAIIVALGKEKA